MTEGLDGGTVLVFIGMKLLFFSIILNKDPPLGDTTTTIYSFLFDSILWFLPLPPHVTEINVHNSIIVPKPKAK